jgi:amino acid transporter
MIDINSEMQSLISSSFNNSIMLEETIQQQHQTMQQQQPEPQSQLTQLQCQVREEEQQQEEEFNTNPIIIQQPQPQPSQSTQKLSLLSLAILVFYNVSGGPFGIEPSLHSAGNLYTIIGFTIAPFIWSIPEALITAELGSAFCQDASGGVAWVDEAFGKELGWISGGLSWISGATDNAIYPTLFLQYLISVLYFNDSMSVDNDNDNGLDLDADLDVDQTMDWYNNTYARFGFVSILSILLALLNYRGLEIVGNASIVVCIIAMSPFVIMTVMGIPRIEPSRWLQLPDENITNYYDDNGEGMSTNYYNSNGNSNDHSGLLSSLLDNIFGGDGGVLWTPFLNNLFWNLNSFDSASNFAGEVRSVSTTYPHGIFLGLFLSIAFYLIPLLVVTGSTDYKQSEWVDGQLGKAAVDIGGNMLGAWTVLAAGISNLALFEAELSSDSYQLMGMAERGHLPKIFATRSERFGTPTVGIIVGTLVIIAMSVADFTQLVELLNFNYAITLLMEYAAFAKLRLTRKDCK